jgi:hypothetical protein
VGGGWCLGISTESEKVEDIVFDEGKCDNYDREDGKSSRIA